MTTARLICRDVLPSWWPWAAHAWLLCAALTTLGCAGTESDPAAPAAPPNLGSTTAPLAPIMTGPDSAQGALGLWRLTGDPLTGTLALAPVPVRQTSGFTPGDSAIPDLTKLFTDPAGLCGDCMKLSGVGYDPLQQATWIDVRVTHPIPAGRPELTAFDLQLLLASDRGEQPVLTFPGAGRTVHPAHLLNADGYTDQLTASLEAALGVNLSVDLFPFINVAVDDDEGNFAGTNVNGFVNVAAPTGHNAFSSGESDTVRLYLDTTGTSQLDLVLALSGSFYRSYTTRGNNLFQKNSPVYFLPEGNRKEAWKVQADVVGSALRAGDAASSAVLQITIRDWQNGLTPQGSGWNPLEADPIVQDRAAIPESSDVQSVAVEIPGVLTAPQTLSVLLASGTGRTAASPLVYTGVTVHNTAGAVAGTYTGLVRVRDSRAPEIAGPGEGDVLFQDGVTFGGLSAFDTYALFTVEVADDYVFVGSDFTNVGNRIRRTGSTIAADPGFFNGVGGVVAYAGLRGDKAFVVSSGAGFSGNGKVQVYHLATGELLAEYAFTGGENPIDLAFLSSTEICVTGYNSHLVYRLNMDPAFTGDRLLATTNLAPYADPTFLARPMEIIRTAGGRVFVACNHLNASFTAAPAGLLLEINPATNAVVLDVDTTGLRNTTSVVEVPGGSHVVAFGPGTYSGDGGSGRLNLGSNIWTPDTVPPGLAWYEAAVTSTGRAFVSDPFVATVAHIGLPFGGTIDHQLDVLPPPAPPFPFITAVGLGRGDYLYATEFNDGILRVWDASAASAAVPPTVVATLSLPLGLDAIGVFE